MSSVPHAWPSLVLALLLASGCGDNGGGSATDQGGSETGAMTTTAGGSTTDTSATTTAATTSAGELSHAADIQPIWDAHCVAACHDNNPTSSGVSATGLNLMADKAYDSIVNKMSVQCGSLVIVAPGDRDGSFLWHKLQGDQSAVCANGGLKMPLGGSLTPEQIDTIGQWIDQGTPP